MFYFYSDQVINLSAIAHILVFESEASVKIHFMGVEEPLYVNFGSNPNLQKFLSKLKHPG
ncbi:hypothetical protein [Acinetobacter sp. Leaf130]|uniref:hypothetical protein n=1 Tax=Acinetobacter sp. Leaf130 TaxID=1736269 RepID=UPI0007007CCE|nr:hypothetical protein [Acinetobacter sp. Leaf130]KQQ77251.1 hypothetical protein ASF86_07020 [Acinetobacter sp. Leaf130]